MSNGSLDSFVKRRPLIFHAAFPFFLSKREDFCLY